MGVLGRFANAVDFACLEQSAVASLTRIERLILDGKIEPLAKVFRSVESGTLLRMDRELCNGSESFSLGAFARWAYCDGAIPHARALVFGNTSAQRSLLQWK